MRILQLPNEYVRWLAFIFPLTIAHLPEEKMRTMELIAYWGYPGEVVPVTTRDGYVVELHHIPYGRNGPSSSACRPVVFLQHGLIVETSSWIKLLPNQSLPFILADAGYDVWMGNYRGTTYGRKHVRLSDKKEEFWKFSWDEMSRYDLVDSINKVLELTGEKSLYYVGHSQGTLVMFARLSEDPQFGKKIRKFFAMAPIGTSVNLKGIVALGARTFKPALHLMFNAYGNRAIIPDAAFIALPKRVMCALRQGVRFCAEALFMVGGPQTSQTNITRMPVFLEGIPAGTSIMNIEHWSQMVVGDGILRHFDHKSKKRNREKYGTETPPIYDYSRIETDMYIYWADEDYLATPEDVRASVVGRLNMRYIKENNHLSGYSHFDFIFGWRASIEIYNPIRDIIRKDFEWTCKS